MPTQTTAEEVRNNSLVAMIAALVSIMAVGIMLFLYSDLKSKVEVMKNDEGIALQLQKERLEIAKTLLLQDSLANIKHDSIVDYEGKIRAAWVEELKQKGLWKH